MGWDSPDAIDFSPDGKFLAYDLMRGEDLEGRDIFVIAVDGSSETLLVDSGYNAVLGWSPDGKRVVFARDRNGNLDVWVAPFRPDRARPGQQVW
jgi:Tol biopolymer transport system component